ncbi:MAG: hypothetical protein GY801_25860, partial [bacterium]|nr:hypothetical protein [bacterium]
MIKQAKLLVILSDLFVIGGVVVLTIFFSLDSCQAAEPVSNTPTRQVTQAEDRVSSIRQLAAANSFGEAGVKAYPQAAQIVEYNSPQGAPLSDMLQN